MDIPRNNTENPYLSNHHASRYRTTKKIHGIHFYIPQIQLFFPQIRHKVIGDPPGGSALQCSDAQSIGISWGYIYIYIFIYLFIFIFIYIYLHIIYIHIYI